MWSYHQLGGCVLYFNTLFDRDALNLQYLSMLGTSNSQKLRVHVE